jgi:hypothetical protein
MLLNNTNKNVININEDDEVEGGEILYWNFNLKIVPIHRVDS